MPCNPVMWTVVCVPHPLLVLHLHVPLLASSVRCEFLEQLEQWRLSSVSKAERTVAEKVRTVEIRQCSVALENAPGSR